MEFDNAGPPCMEADASVKLDAAR